MYIVVSYKGNEGYYRTFDTKEDAQEFLHKEEYDFRTRELYNYEEFLNEWAKEYDSEEKAARDGYIWDDLLEIFTHLRRKEGKTDELKEQIQELNNI